MCNLRTGTESLKPCITHISLHVQKEERTEQKTSYSYPALQSFLFEKDTDRGNNSGNFTMSNFGVLRDHHQSSLLILSEFK